MSFLFAKDPVPETSPSKPQTAILSAFAGLLGLLGIALYFTGWIYRWTYFSFFYLELATLNFPPQSFLMVPIQVFLGSTQARLQTLLAVAVTIGLIWLSLWIVQPASVITASPHQRLMLSPRESQAQTWLDRLNRLWILQRLRSLLAVVPDLLLRDSIIVAWVLAGLFWIAQVHGLADARRDARINTSALPVVTIVSNQYTPAFGRNPTDLFTDPSLQNVRIIGDLGLFEQQFQGKEINETGDTTNPLVWRLLIADSGWLYIFRSLSSDEDLNKSPVVVALREGRPGEQMLIFSSTPAPVKSSP
jgi:hypothetical protein